MFRAAYLLAVMMCLFSSTEAQTREHASREEAVALVKKAIRVINQVGIDPVIRAINRRHPRFLYRDLFLFVHDLKRPALLVAHGNNRNLVGRNTIDLRDQNGKYFVREIYKVASTKGKGWVNYRWTNAERTAFEDKTSYVERVGDYIVGVGVYKPDQPNKTTVGIISGNPVSAPTYLQIAHDLSVVLNDADLRVVPVVGIGGAQNIRDVESLKGIDIGLTQSNVLANYLRNNKDHVGRRESKNIVYIAKLFREEIHIIARSDIASPAELNGKKVNLDQIGSGTQFTIRDVFKVLNIKVDEVNMPQTDALAKVKSGELAATVLVSGKSAPVVAGIKRSDGLKLLPIPFAQVLNDYVPGEFTAKDYPELVAPGEKIATAAVHAALISFNWKKNSDRYRRVSRFAQALVEKFDELKKSPRHPKWREVSLSSTFSGWHRFEPMKALVPRKAANDQASLAEMRSLLKDIEDNSERARLFLLFEKWIKSREEADRQD